MKEKRARYDRRTAEDGSFYFVLKGANGEVQMTSETYSRQRDRERGIQDAKRSAVEAAAATD